VAQLNPAGKLTALPQTLYVLTRELTELGKNEAEK